MYNEFVTTYGKHSILTPLGYRKIQKTMRRGAKTQSVVTQFEIHTIALRFVSPVLKFPQLFELVDNRSYVMEHLIDYTVMPSYLYRSNLYLIQELNRFYSYMISEGYFPCNFTLLLNKDGTYTMVDFSQFGYYQKGQVSLKHMKTHLSLFDADQAYGMLSFLLSEIVYIGSEKIEGSNLITL